MNGIVLLFTSSFYYKNKMNKKNIKIRLQTVEDQISRISERLYQPQISNSEQRELLKRKKKLGREKLKLNRKLSIDELS